MLVAQQGKLLWNFSSKTTPLTAQRQFIIGSQSKQITAALILQAVDQQRLALQDPLVKFLPEHRERFGDAITDCNGLLTFWTESNRLCQVLRMAKYLDQGFQPLPVELLACPSSAPWLKIGDVMDFLEEIRPRRSFSTHTALHSEHGHNLNNSRIQLITEKHGGTFSYLEPGQSLEF